MHCRKLQWELFLVYSMASYNALYSIKTFYEHPTYFIILYRLSSSSQNKEKRKGGTAFLLTVDKLVDTSKCNLDSKPSVFLK